jgi:hypothetical protein
VLKDAVVFTVPGWPEMKADWHLAKRWGSPMEIDIRDDGSLLITGEQTYELRPAVEVDEDSGESIEVMPEVDPGLLRAAAGLSGGPEPEATVWLDLSQMPTMAAWEAFRDLARQRPGSHRLIVTTPDGQLPLAERVSFTAADLAVLSRTLGQPVDLRLERHGDTSAVIAGMTW